MAGRNRRFGQEFKDEAVRMVLDGPRPISHVAKELGIHDTTLGNWVNAFRRTRGDDVALARDVGEKSERELALERENRKLREENEFLKKAAAFFAREQR
ncbi:transposase [Nonomuraea sp. NPDC004702]